VADETKHGMSRHVNDGGCVDYCDCGLTFFAPYRGKLGRFESEEQREDAIRRADAAWGEHLREVEVGHVPQE